ncbi:apolipoprotein N-acyltransferase [Enemella sp. A6]|uniref:apolipoprotein N-acyltransferase n=1 Tax=Enemella sp. A6 TaxID=3440152 RepID=UPI003EC0731E
MADESRTVPESTTRQAVGDPGDSRFRTLPTWLPIVAAVVSGLLLAWAYGLTPWWGATWLAPIPLLAVVASVRWRTAAGLGAITGAVASVSLLPYLIGLSGPIDALSISALRAAQWAIVALVARLAITRLPVVLAMFVVPAFLAGFDVLMTIASPHGSAGSPAYSQMDALPVIQVAALGGTAGVVFLPMLFASAVASLLAHRQRTRRGVIAPGLVLVLALGFGAWRLAGQVPVDGVPVALIAGDEFDNTPDDWRRVWAGYESAITEATETEPQIIVLPEKLFQVSSEDAQVFLSRAEELAEQYGVHLVVGITELGIEDHNRAYLISPGADAIHYDKRHMIPGFESHFDRGSTNLTTRLDGMEAGVAICKDMDFPGTIRGYDAAVMLVPAWDFDADAWFHSRIAMLRGVENGTTVVRSARNGRLTVSDSRGRVLAEAPSGTPHQVLAAHIPNTPRATTLYSHIGDGFGWASLLFAIGVIGYAAFGRRTDQ